MSLGSVKLIAKLHTDIFEVEDKYNIELHFYPENFMIYFNGPLINKDIIELKNNFYPFISSDYISVKMNYIYLKELSLDNNNYLSMEIYNPTNINIFTVSFKDLKYKNKFSFFASVPSNDLIINKIILDIKKKIKNQILKYINNFNNVIQIFLDFISVERKYNNITNNLFLKAFDFGNKYYENSIKQYISSQKKINLIPENERKLIDEHLKTINDEIEKTIILNLIKTKNDSSKGSDELKNEFENLDSDIDSINIKDLFQNYPKFNKFLDDIKKMTSFYTEKTINLILDLLEINLNEKNISNIIDIEKNLNIKINNWKQEHLFVPDNSVDNIISNASLIIERKFFEFLFKKFFSDIINLEINKDKTITNDEFCQILINLKSVKSILFNNDNQENFL